MLGIIAKPNADVKHLLGIPCACGIQDRISTGEHSEAGPTTNRAGPASTID